jgi:hypothetical protein
MSIGRKPLFHFGPRCLMDAGREISIVSEIGYHQHNNIIVLF